MPLALEFFATLPSSTPPAWPASLLGRLDRPMLWCRTLGHGSEPVVEKLQKRIQARHGLAAHRRGVAAFPIKEALAGRRADLPALEQRLQIAVRHVGVLEGRHDRGLGVAVDLGPRDVL